MLQQDIEAVYEELASGIDRVGEPDANIFLQIFANPGEHDAKRMLLNMITTSLYLGLPLLWSGMMAWAGIHVGRAIDSVSTTLARSSENAGKQGAAIGKAAASRRIGR